MPVYVDIECNQCGTELHDVWSTMVDTPCSCGGTWTRIWTFTRGVDPGTHPSEKVVVYESAMEGGHIQYPGRTDSDVPQRLKDRGYVRRELNVRDLAAFEKKHHVINERRHFDRNGRND